MIYIITCTNISVIYAKNIHENKNNKNIFNKIERRCSVVKTQKVCEEGWDGTN